MLTNKQTEGFLKTLGLRLSTTTLQRKACEISVFLAFVERQKKELQEIERSDIEAFLLSRPLHRQTRQAICCTIRQFYNHLKSPENPAKGIEFRPESRQRLWRVPSEKDISSKIAQLEKDGSSLGLRNRLLVELAYGSGLRRAELTRLNIGDISHDDGLVRVLGKGNKERIVPLSGSAVALVRELAMKRNRFRGPLLVSFAGRRLKLESVNEVMKRVVGIRPHLLRHACASHMLKKGCNIRIIQELLGHNRLTSTQLYTHITKEELRCKIHSAHPRSRA